MKTILVVAAVIIENNNILVAKRSGGDFDGMFEFPGGKVEAGESNEEAVKREIFEELGVKIHIDEFFMTIEYDYPEFHLKMHCFVCSLIDKEIQLITHSEFRWITSDTDNIEWVPADAQIFGYLKEEGY